MNTPDRIRAQAVGTMITINVNAARRLLLVFGARGEASFSSTEYRFLLEHPRQDQPAHDKAAGNGAGQAAVAAEMLGFASFDPAYLACFSPSPRPLHQPGSRAVRMKSLGYYPTWICVYRAPSKG